MSFSLLIVDWDGLCFAFLPPRSVLLETESGLEWERLEEESRGEVDREDEDCIASWIGMVEWEMEENEEDEEEEEDEEDEEDEDEDDSDDESDDDSDDEFCIGMFNVDRMLYTFSWTPAFDAISMTDGPFDCNWGIKLSHILE